MQSAEMNFMKIEMNGKNNLDEFKLQIEGF